MSQPEAARDEEEQDFQRQPPQHANDGRPAAHRATAAVSAISLLYLSSSCADKKNGEKKKGKKKGKKYLGPGGPDDAAAKTEGFLDDGVKMSGNRQTEAETGGRERASREPERT